MMEDKDIIRSPATERKKRVPAGQRLVNYSPVFQYNGLTKSDKEKWVF